MTNNNDKDKPDTSRDTSSDNSADLDFSAHQNDDQNTLSKGASMDNSSDSIDDDTDGEYPIQLKQSMIDPKIHLPGLADNELGEGELIKDGQIKDKPLTYHAALPAPAHLPESMIRAVKHLPNDQESLILFTRHSLRERSNGKGFASYDLPLTPKGRVLAKAWGRWLAANLSYSLDADSIASPIWRCVDTAKLMQEGAGVDKPITHQSLLVEPGSLVTDAVKANEVFKNGGALSFINSFLQNRLDSTKPANQGGLDILSLLYDSQPKAGHLALAVSHDTLLAAFLGVMMRTTQITWDDWPKMMEGVFLWFDDKPFTESTATFIWRDERFSVLVADLLEEEYRRRL